MVGLFEEHDRSRFEITGYSYGPDDGSAARASARSVRSLAGGPRRFRRGSRAADQEDGIDLLVDRAGHTFGSRLAILAAPSGPGAECISRASPGPSVMTRSTESSPTPKSFRPGTSFYTSARGGCRVATTSTIDGAGCRRRRPARNTGLRSTLSCSRASTRATSCAATSSTCGWGACARSDAVLWLLEAHPRSPKRTSNARPPAPAWIRAIDLRAAIGAGGTHREASLRRPRARYLALRRAATESTRCGRGADAHLQGEDLRRPCRRQRPARSGPAGSDRRFHRGIPVRGCSRSRLIRRRARRYQGISEPHAIREYAFRHRRALRGLGATAGADLRRMLPRRRPETATPRQSQPSSRSRPLIS